MRAAFVFDPARCTACEACRVACGIENNEGRDTGWRSVLTYNPSRHPALPTQHLTLACNHCDTPACAIGCPANAYDRDPATGAVLLDPEKCIGCRYCSWLCPYDAPKFDEAKGTMSKCTFCSPRVAAGGQPACTQACPTGALAFGERGEEELEPHYVGLGLFGLGPALTVTRNVPPPPASIATEDDDPPAQPVPPRKITLRSEWALVFFTIVMPALVAWIGAAQIRPDIPIPPAIFLGLGALAIAASALHLGKPLRSWRAILNVKSSWLSREILFTNLFLGAAAISMFVPGLAESAAWTAVAMGTALAFSIDMVYRAIPTASREEGTARPFRIHSADALLTVIFLVAVATSNMLVALPMAVLKGTLFAMRALGTPRESQAAIPVGPGVMRIVLLVAAVSPLLPWEIAAGLAIAGEAIDRALFYRELEPTSPARRMAEQLLAAATRPLPVHGVRGRASSPAVS